jgi:uncharacterized protein (TIGR02145 family)
MKKLLLFIAIFSVLQANAQNYLITFAGSGASIAVASVKVENLATGTTLTLNGSDVLRLTTTTSINDIKDYQSSEMKIYPNPMTDNSTVEIFPPVAGNAAISILDMTGKQVIQIQSYLENQKQAFRISGLKKGFYLVSVKGSNYQFSEKLMSSAESAGTIQFEKTNNAIQAVMEKTEKAGKSDSKGTQTIIDMTYAIGNRLKFTGISGIYSTVKTDIPSSDKTITFKFVPCTDGDNNNYPIVVIGPQVWMAENLKTTQYNDNTTIPLILDNSVWSALSTPGFCWYNHDEGSYKDTYGALYNWFAVNTGKLCPLGWHVPRNDHLTTLTTFLGGLSEAGGKLKETSTTHWLTPNLGATNETGFTAVPGGLRAAAGSFGNFNSATLFWSSTAQYSTSSYFRNLSFDYNGVYAAYTSSGVTYNSFDNNYGFSVRCLQDNLSTLTTTAASKILSTNATGGGNIIDDGGADITGRGVCWSLSHNPTTADSKTTDGTGTGTFSSSITGLTDGATYYMRAYAINGAGTAYGDELTFTTPSKATDGDGNVYNTVIIGTQTWMTENLKTTKYNDASAIPNITDNAEWAALTTPAYCWYDNNAALNKDIYGALYNWYVVDAGSNGGKNVCPIGYHVPIATEWTTLITYLGGESPAGAKMKEAGIVHWPNTIGTNESGFTGLPGGNRVSTDGTFTGLGARAYWLSSTESGANAFYRYINSTLTLDTYGGNYGGKKAGFSIRCLKDN